MPLRPTSDLTQTASSAKAAKQNHAHAGKTCEDRQGMQRTFAAFLHSETAISALTPASTLDKGCP